jgi:hypothetical protein
MWVLVQVGDGDCGSTLAKGAAAVQQQVDTLPFGDPAGTALALGRLLGTMGGTSGAVVGALPQRFLDSSCTFVCPGLGPLGCSSGTRVAGLPVPQR